MNGGGGAVPSASGAALTEAAECSALVSLTAVFGQPVQAEISSITNYSEAVKTSSGMDSLVCAEIAGVRRNDADRSWSAVAVLEKQRAALLYAELMLGSRRLTSEITNVPDAGKTSPEAFSRCRLAATITDTNKLHAALLPGIGGGAAGLDPAEIRTGADYRLEAAKATRGIPIAVKVEGDSQNRVGNAFAVALGRIGFKSGCTDNRYVLNATLPPTGANLSGNRYQFCRYNVDAYLTDTSNGSRMSPYNIAGGKGTP
jgi:hypothetical protein